MRFKEQGVWTDGNGRRIDAATVSVYLAGTTTAASVYAASSGGVAVNSVTTDTSGLYEFWVDDTDYTQDQLFKITFTKPAFNTTSIDDIEIFKSNRLILSSTNNSFIDGRTNVRLVTVGAVRQEHTAGIAGTRAYHFDSRPNNFDDTSVIVTRIDLEGSSGDIRAKGTNFAVDITGATNAHVNALEVSKTGDVGSGMKLDAVHIQPGINVIEHRSGATTATDTAFKYDDSGASYTDVTTEFGSAASDVSIFDENSDYIYIGNASQFNAIEVSLATVATKSVKPIFEYSQGGSSWNTLPVSDDTNGFRENGNIFYSTPGDWATDTVNAVASKYWVRIQRNSNNVPVVPIEDTIKIISSVSFSWDASGNLIVNDITAAAISGTTITSSGVMTANSLQIDDTSADHQYIIGVNELAADRTVTLPLLTGADEFMFFSHHMKDEDDMASDSDAHGATQQSIKAYVDAHGVVQIVNTQTGAVATGTTVMVVDDTIPQNTEGDEYMTLAITPTSATNKLKIDVVLNLASTATGAHDIIAALFQDSTADAIAAQIEVAVAANHNTIMKLTHYMTSGTTSATTFKIRAGVGAAGTTTFNGRTGSRLFGGVLISSITITEIQV